MCTSFLAQNSTDYVYNIDALHRTALHSDQHAKQDSTDDNYAHIFHKILVDPISWLHVCVSFQGDMYEGIEPTPLDLFRETHRNKDDCYSPAVEHVLVSKLSMSSR